MTEIPERAAMRLFMTAMHEQRAGELLGALFDGATATVGADGELVIIPAAQLEAMVEHNVPYVERVPVCGDCFKPVERNAADDGWVHG